MISCLMSNTKPVRRAPGTRRRHGPKPCTPRSGSATSSPAMPTWPCPAASRRSTRNCPAAAGRAARSPSRCCRTRVSVKSACSVPVWLPPRLQPERLRRLQLAAHNEDGPAFVLREPSAAQRPTSAPLRLALRPGGADVLAVRVLKRRGPPHSAPPCWRESTARSTAPTWPRCTPHSTPCRRG